MTENTEPQKPTVYCRCCGEIMDAIHQEAMMPGRPSYWLITCWNKQCKMEGQTLSERHYASIDLSKYLCGKGA